MAEDPEVLAKLASSSAHLIAASTREDLLELAKSLGLKTCFRQRVVDAHTLHESVRVGKSQNYLSISFKDPTNIPLELVIASLQYSQTILLKEIARDDLDDAVVSLGVMEVGADGVMYSPEDFKAFDQFLTRLQARQTLPLKLEVATVVRTEPIGMGYRSCVDLTTLFSETEGMLVGSTSQGGVLCCPEVFFLPYMELRPFRVNAGAVHSYVFNGDNTTSYLTELKAGSQVLIVGLDGQTRTASAGRIKTEVRPLRLIEVKFDGGELINVIMQDDWHVRIFSHEGKPLNISALKYGDRVMAHKASPGRHVGIKIEEQILEQ